MLGDVEDGVLRKSNFVQHRLTWWANERNMLDSTMLDDVAAICWIRLAGPLGQ